MKANNFGMVPLMSASEHCQEEVFDYLMSQCPNLSKEDQINSYELLGGSFANDKEHYDLGKCYAYLTKVSLIISEDNLSTPHLKISLQQLTCCMGR